MASFLAVMVDKNAKQTKISRVLILHESYREHSDWIFEATSTKSYLQIKLYIVSKLKFNLPTKHPLECSFFQSAFYFEREME